MKYMYLEEYFNVVIVLQYFEISYQSLIFLRHLWNLKDSNCSEICKEEFRVAFSLVLVKVNCHPHEHLFSFFFFLFFFPLAVKLSQLI